jgi:aldose 1-epimerase
MAGTEENGTMSIVTLESTLLRVYIDPDQGTSLKGLYACKDGNWLALMPDVCQPLGRLDAASFLMVPYSNRIEDGAFTFEGQSYQLKGAEQHAIHGDVRTRAWKTVEQTATSLHCTFHSVQYENVNWPWPFEARAEYQIQGSVFSQRLALWNRGDSPMPAGFGWHPYFVRTVTREGEPVHLRFTVAGIYPDANDNRIPSGPARPPSAEQDHSLGKLLDPDDFWDACCQGYDGNGSITWPESGIRLAFDCSPECSHLVVFNPPFPIFAMEPVTNANNGVNQLAAGWPDSGVAVLKQGECLGARFDMRIETDI